MCKDICRNGRFTDAGRRNDLVRRPLTAFLTGGDMFIPPFFGWNKKTYNGEERKVDRSSLFLTADLYSCIGEDDATQHFIRYLFGNLSFFRTFAVDIELSALPLK